MFARTSNIYFTRKVAKATKALAALGVLLFSACTSDKVIEEIIEIDLNGTDPLSFTCRVQDNAPEQNTRSTALTSGFMVSTYKAYALTTQQTVMEKYDVEYKTSGTAWDGTVRPYWDYTHVSGQYEKFWDFSAFPYRFHAIAPFPANPTGYVLSDKSLEIPAPYYYQTCHNGMVQTIGTNGKPTSDPAEPHMLAQVHRDAAGHDTDLLARTNDQVELNNNSSSLNREVWMPFHHLNSKIRFGVYSLHPWVTDNHLYIHHLTINVSSDYFVTAASGFTATSTTDNWRKDTGNSGFYNMTYKNATDLATTPLLRFDGGVDVPGNDMRECQTQRTAFWLQCKDGIMQLPQENVQMTVTFDLCQPDGTPFKHFEKVPIAIELPDLTLQPLHTWQPGYIYTYYLIIGGLDEKLEITFTATLTPWEDVTGSLSTDLEQ